MNVKAKRNKLYHEGLLGQSIGRVQRCSNYRVLRDASESEALRYSAIKRSYLVHFLPIEEIVIVVEHQDRLRSWLVF
ncbi:hypothetical protein TNCV_3641421 [Trichonephila clavipes]|nr:hypothetical protein TNCV_3641421 [Trichonephila clavipes]